MQTEYFHLCSEGTKSDVLFHDREEFVSGMNVVAVVARSVNVAILAFCLMDNHFHFILRCTEGQVALFAARIAQCYKIRRARRFRDSAMEVLKWSWFVLEDEDYRLKSIAYVLNNPLKAAYRSWFNEYPWSSGSLYFRDGMSLEVEMDSFRSVRDLSAREKRKVLGSQLDFPEDWMVTKWGFIWPGCYVRWQEVEKLYNGSVKWFMYFLSAKQGDEVEAMMLAKRPLGLPDVEVRERARLRCLEWFGHKRLRSLSLEERRRMARWLMAEMGCSEKQVLRVVRLQKE